MDENEKRKRADADLLERLVVAQIAGYVTRCSYVNWDYVICNARDGLDAIRKAQGPQEERTASVEVESRALDDSDVSGRVRLALGLRETFTTGDIARAAERLRCNLETATANLFQGATTALKDADSADAIIHALVDERVRWRNVCRWAHQSFEKLHALLPADDPRGAADEDPLTDVERRVFKKLPATLDELGSRVCLVYPEINAALCSMLAIGAIRRYSRDGWVVYCPNDAFARTKEAAQ